VSWVTPAHDCLTVMRASDLLAKAAPGDIWQCDGCPAQWLVTRVRWDLLGHVHVDVDRVMQAMSR
jgi:hypothetical protein